jgi:hypothetical protein
MLNLIDVDVQKAIAFACANQEICCVRAHGVIEHRNAAGELLHKEEVDNLITNAGRVFLHSQGYSTAAGVAGGFCYIALSNDTATETATSTTLSTEIAANGLARAQGTVTLATGAGVSTTIAKTFTCATAPQAAQKAALFTAASSGTMNHVLAFTQRSLQIGDTLAVTFTITTS